MCLHRAWSKLKLTEFVCLLQVGKLGRIQIKSKALYSILVPEIVFAQSLSVLEQKLKTILVNSSTRSLKGRRAKKSKSGKGMGTLDEDNDEEETGGITIKASSKKSANAEDKEDQRFSYTTLLIYTNTLYTHLFSYCLVLNLYPF